MTNWRERALERVRAASHCALFLDFDGTLAEPTPKPHQARLPLATKRVLKDLARRPKVQLLFISGRQRADLWRRVRLRRCQYLGLFGAEDSVRPRLRRSVAMERLRTRAAARLADLPGVWIEDKGPAFVVHYRKASARTRQQALKRLRAMLRGTTTAHYFRSAHGLEVVPPDIRGKGAVIRHLLRQPGWKHALPIYLGDDHSDESAFRAARRGVTIRVGSGRRTAARHTLKDPTDVRAFLQMIADALR